MEEKEKEYALLVFSQLLIIGTLCVQCLVVPNIQSMNICFKKILIDLISLIYGPVFLFRRLYSAVRP